MTANVSAFILSLGIFMAISCPCFPKLEQKSPFAPSVLAQIFHIIYVPGSRIFLHLTKWQKLAAWLGALLQYHFVQTVASHLASATLKPINNNCDPVINLLVIFNIIHTTAVYWYLCLYSDYHTCLIAG